MTGGAEFADSQSGERLYHRRSERVIRRSEAASNVTAVTVSEFTDRRGILARISFPILLASRLALC